MLNKKVCKRCHSLGKRIHGRELTNWEKMQFEENWQRGVVFCGFRGAMSIDLLPDKECLFLTEHVMSFGVEKKKPVLKKKLCKECHQQYGSTITSFSYWGFDGVVHCPEVSRYVSIHRECPLDVKKRSEDKK
jgi:hypothetical protein